jgi:site-specific DNA-methyltransferase (adenine-specific)
VTEPLPFPVAPYQLRGVVQGDAVEVLRRLPADSFHACVTDPAYESLERHRAKGTTTRLKVSDASSNQWFETFPNDRFDAFLFEVYRVLRAPAYALIMCDDPTDEHLRPIARRHGFWVWPSWTWVKTKTSSEDPEPSDADPEQDREDDTRIGMGYHGRRSTERIMVLEKRTVIQHPTQFEIPNLPEHLQTLPLRQQYADPRGKGRQLTHRGWPDVFFAPRVNGGYPTQKPLSLVRRLVEQVTSPGEAVIDPFCGSGVVGVAAEWLGREFLLSDLSATAVALARDATGKVKR